jgi:cytoskeletal protein RodZ
MPNKVRKSARERFSWKMLTILGVLVVVLAVVVLYSTGHVSFHKSRIAPVIPSTNPAPKSSSTNKTDKSTVSNSGSAQTTNPTDTSQKAGTPSATNTTPPIEPTGTFVSNHYPGKNGDPTTEQSVCNTTPGATCFIQFTQGSVVKLLAPQTVGSDGATYWSWDAKAATSIGLTAGSWNVSAVASLNGQTQTSDDAIALVMQP